MSFAKSEIVFLFAWANSIHVYYLKKDINFPWIRNLKGKQSPLNIVVTYDKIKQIQELVVPGIIPCCLAALVSKWNVHLTCRWENPHSLEL